MERTSPKSSDIRAYFSISIRRDLIMRKLSSSILIYITIFYYGLTLMKFTCSSISSTGIMESLARLISWLNKLIRFENRNIKILRTAIEWDFSLSTSQYWSWNDDALEVSHLIITMMRWRQQNALLLLAFTDSWFDIKFNLVKLL